MIKFHSIDSFRHAVTSVKRAAGFHGVPLPVVRYRGYVKLHGTNAAIRFKDGVVVHAQSRERIITPDDDNMGFAAWVAQNAAVLADTFDGDITVFGEWIGPGIQKNVALNQLPSKMFAPFAYTVGDATVNEQGESLYTIWNFHDEPSQLPPGVRFVSIGGFIDIDIDFNSPDRAVETLERVTAECEAKCPFGAALGAEGIGEGYVWHPLERIPFLPPEQQHRAWFKTKGEKHGNKATNNAVKVNVVAEKIEDFGRLISAILPDWRLEQGLATLGAEPSKQRTGDFIKWVMSDIHKEELDTVEASGFTFEQVARELPERIRAWFFARV